MDNNKKLKYSFRYSFYLKGCSLAMECTVSDIINCLFSSELNFVDVCDVSEMIILKEDRKKEFIKLKETSSLYTAISEMCNKYILF